uniref:AAA+ ATPase domain-containing protein n=1 Tax=Musca domestica TaxID=7370 RepID=A0A1I8NII3_MUSDO
MFSKCLFLISAIFYLTNTGVVALFDPLPMGLAAGAALGLYKFDTLKDNTYCRFAECCNERSIPADIKGLQQDLDEHLFGQHIVKQQLIPALEAHFKEKENSKKPLVISFHGTPGTGKNFVADKIAQRIYEKGSKSKFVRKYMGRGDFPLESDAHLYSARILKDAREAISACPRSLFIFDEVDKMPPMVFESLASLINYNALVDGVDSTQAIFIFLSNTAGVHISDKLGKLIKSGTLRDKTRLSDFEQILEKGAYNLDGGLKKTSLIESHLIDHFIPFLPLEKSHVYKCAQAEFAIWGKTPKDEVVERVVNDYITYDRVHGIFATSGCKKLGKKVAVEAMSPDL